MRQLWASELVTPETHPKAEVFIDGVKQDGVFAVERIGNTYNDAVEVSRFKPYPAEVDKSGKDLKRVVERYNDPARVQIEDVKCLRR